MKGGSCNRGRMGSLTTFSSPGIFAQLCIVEGGILQTTRCEWLERMVSGEKLRATLKTQGMTC